MTYSLDTERTYLLSFDTAVVQCSPALDRYFVNEDGEEVPYGFAENTAQVSEYRVGSHFTGYIEIWPLGDGETYFDDFSVNSNRIELR